MKRKLTFIFALLISLVAYSLAEDPVTSPVPSLEEIIERAKMQQSKLVEEIEDAVFSAESVYRERKKNGELKKELVAKRKVYMKRGGRRREEYLSIIRNGKELHGKEMEKELRDSKSRGQIVPQGRLWTDYSP